MASPLPSRTSILVAAARALGARIPEPELRNPDMLAEKLLGPEELELIQAHPISVAFPPGGAEPAFEAIRLTMMMLIRTKFIDEKLKRAIGDGATQVVILGAGFDARASRLHSLLKSVRVFEVDSAGTQARKKQRVNEALGGPPPNLTYVTVDFNRDRLFESLRDEGYDPKRKTFFTWEGVCMYIPEEGVRETLSGVAANASPGSRLVMDYTTMAWLAFMKKHPQFGPSRFFTAWNEPWVFGLPDGAEREFFESVGLAPREFFAGFGPEALKRYLTRPDGTVLGSLPANAAYPQLPPEAQAAIAELNKNGASVYTLVELEVP